MAGGKNTITEWSKTKHVNEQRIFLTNITDGWRETTQPHNAQKRNMSMNKLIFSNFAFMWALSQKALVGVSWKWRHHFENNVFKKGVFVDNNVGHNGAGSVGRPAHSSKAQRSILQVQIENMYVSRMCCWHLLLRDILAEGKLDWNNVNKFVRTYDQ